MNARTSACALLVAVTLSSCAHRDPANGDPEVVEATSLLGRPLHRYVGTGTALRAQEAALVAAEANWAHQESESNAIWVGRRLAYLGRYGDAIAWYQTSIKRWPESYRLHRHLGHRYLSTRKIDLAIDAFETARALAATARNRIEADGAPNAAGTPRSSMIGNIYYHLALARYCRGEFLEAAASWRRCVTEWALTDDSKIAALHWLYTSLVRAGQIAEARAALDLVGEDPDVIENVAYLKLIELYRSGSAASFDAAAPSSGAAFKYGVAWWYLSNGSPEKGTDILKELAAMKAWPSFGVLAAEADLARMPSDH